MQSRGSEGLGEAGSEAASNFGEDRASGEQGVKKSAERIWEPDRGQENPESIAATKSPVSSFIK